MKFRLALIGALAMALCGQAMAQPTAAMKMSMDYDGTLYPLNLLPVNVLRIHADGHSTPGGYGADVSMNSSGILRALYKVDIVAIAEGRLGGDGQIYPAAFSYVHHDGKRVRRVHVTWSTGEVSVVSTPPYSDLGHPPATRAQQLAATDPVTQFVRIAVAAGPQDICRGPDHFFDGKQLYALDFSHAAPAALTDSQRALGLTHGGQCTVHFTELAGFKPEPPEKRDQGLKGPITLIFGQVGADGPWVIAEIHVDTVIGFAKIELNRISVSGARPKI